MMGGMVPDMQMAGSVARRLDKQSEYLTVVLVTLLSRAAIEGGADSEAAYELGDIYLRRVEMSSVGGGNFNTIGFQAACEFTEMVIKAQKHTNDYHIDACKSYIAKNLRKDLKVGDIAPAIGISRTYLAHKFREAEGITVQEYILREKCGHAANMLTYSDYPISIIAEYFCFSSPSHFGNCFKRIYGMTPKAYRLKNFKK
ncbi:MAG: AraC family transcriptional regulator [Lachnospiraceae bacterium]|nr:AraC family transcriptional regulator [Lachnospiraceae bacterium]MDE7201074.1 AraC family transcriptional regulator [Lachnospiraceae bacterium]